MRKEVVRLIVTRHASIDETRPREKGGPAKIVQKLEQILPEGVTTRQWNSSSSFPKPAVQKSKRFPNAKCWDLAILRKCRVIAWNYAVGAVNVSKIVQIEQNLDNRPPQTLDRQLKTQNYWHATISCSSYYTLGSQPRYSTPIFKLSWKISSRYSWVGLFPSRPVMWN